MDYVRITRKIISSRRYKVHSYDIVHSKDFAGLYYIRIYPNEYARGNWKGYRYMTREGKLISNEEFAYGEAEYRKNNFYFSKELAERLARSRLKLIIRGGDNVTL